MLHTSAARAQWPIAGGLLLSIAAGCGGSSDQQVSDTSTLGVTVHVAKRETLRDVATASGIVVPSAAGDWLVTAPDVAEIAELTRVKGETVKTGDVLVRFEIASRTQELAALQLETLAAEQAVERARAELTRQTALSERGLIARSAFDNTRAQLSVAENQLRLVTERLQIARGGEDLSVVRARFPGTILEIFHAKGEMVSGPADPVLRVVDPTRIQVSIQLPVAQIARVMPGQTATVRAIAGATDESATVALTPRAVDPNAPTGEVRLAFQNPAVVLALDAPVSVELLLDVRTGAIAVPSQAVRSDELGPYLMLVNDSGVAERRNVRLGLVTPQLTQVAVGLNEGERVVVSELTDESAGLPVTVVP